MKPIVHAPHTVLRTPAKTISVFDTRIAKLVSEMKRTLEGTVNPKGVGLAAPQIGEPYRMFITKPHDASKIRVFINPHIIKHSEQLTDGVPERENKLEGCLSIPKIWGRVKRAKSLTLRWQDATGKIHEEEFTGFLATIIQHETDHTNGILFTQRVLEQKGKLYQAVKDKEGKDALEELEF
ncbi:peptide deformylase [Candidatus Gottesmanbacteria bacterium]|nr:peptide deformylase [Candidatus Gottesmanbacteria bacterium]